MNHHVLTHSHHISAQQWCVRTRFVCFLPLSGLRAKTFHIYIFDESRRRVFYFKCICRLDLIHHAALRGAWSMWTYGGFWPLIVDMVNRCVTKRRTQLDSCGAYSSHERRHRRRNSFGVRPQWIEWYIITFDGKMHLVSYLNGMSMWFFLVGYSFYL